MNTGFTKQGIINASAFSETFVNPLDTRFYVEPDGSTWIRIAHHNDPATVGVFGSTITNFEKPYYIDKDRWFNVGLCNKITNSTYELMVKQATTSTATETKYRWIQTVNPMTATFGDVDEADVTKITTSGYSTLTNYGGIYAKKASAYITANNSKSSNWYGAIGSWTLSSNKLPGFGASISTGYLDLYLRIDNQNNSGVSVFKNSIIADDLLEI